VSGPPGTDGTGQTNELARDEGHSSASGSRSAPVAGRRARAASVPEGFGDSGPWAWAQLVRLRDMGVVVAVVLITIAMSAGWLKDAAGDWSTPDTVTKKLDLALFAVTMGLLLIWHQATGHEIDTLQRLGARFLADVPGPTFTLVALVAFLLGGLAITSNRPAVWASLYLILKTVELWGWWFTQLRVREGLVAAAGTRGLSDAQKGAIPVLDVYYLRHPIHPLIGSMLTLTATALVLAVLGEVRAGTDLGRLATSASLVVLIASVVTNEAIVAHWRRIRDRQLAPLLSQTAKSGKLA